MPLALVSPVLVGVIQLSITGSLSIEPITNVVIAIRVDEATEAVVDIVSELALVNDVVNFLSNTSHLAVFSELSQNVLIVLALSKGSRLVNGLTRVPHDVFQFQRTELVPLLLSGLQGNTVRLLRASIAEWIRLRGLSAGAGRRRMVSSRRWLVIRGLW